MSLNELILNQPKPWLPIRVWNCVIDNIFQLLPNAVTGRILRATNNQGVGTWQDPTGFLVTSLQATGADLALNGSAGPTAALHGDITIANTGTLTAFDVTAGSLTTSTAGGKDGHATVNGVTTLVGAVTAGSVGQVALTAGNVAASTLSVASPVILGVVPQNSGIGLAPWMYNHIRVVVLDTHVAGENTNLTAQQTTQGLVYNWSPGVGGSSASVTFPSAATIVNYMKTNGTVFAGMTWSCIFINAQNNTVVTTLRVLQSSDATTHYINSGTSGVTQQYVSGSQDPGRTAMRIFWLMLNNVTVSSEEVLIIF